MTYMSISVATTAIYEKNQGRRGSRNLAGTFFAKKIGKLFRATIWRDLGRLALGLSFFSQREG